MEPRLEYPFLYGGFKLHCQGVAEHGLRHAIKRQDDIDHPFLGVRHAVFQIIGLQNHSRVKDGVAVNPTSHSSGVSLIRLELLLGTSRVAVCCEFVHRPKWAVFGQDTSRFSGSHFFPELM